MEKQTDLIVIKGVPPNFDEIRKHLKPDNKTIFAWGVYLYNPHGLPIDKPLMEHEKRHCYQQLFYREGSLWAKMVSHKARINEWWKRYLGDPDFRLSQEIPAYQVQYQEMKKLVKDKNRQFNILRGMAKDLSGEIYGKMISFDQALEAIKREEIYDFKT